MVKILFGDIFIYTSGEPCIKLKQIVCAILVEDIMRNSSVKLFCILTSGSEENVIRRHFLSKALTALLMSGVEPFEQCWKKAS